MMLERIVDIEAAGDDGRGESVATSPALTEARWDQGLTIEVPGTPQPQGSKTFKGLRGGRGILVESNRARLRPWRDSIVWHARQAHGARPPLEGPVSVRLTFTFSRPAGHFGKRGLRPSAPNWPAVRPDTDKLARCALDALTEARVWRDDGRVVELIAVKLYGEPGLIINVASLTTEGGR